MPPPLRSAPSPIFFASFLMPTETVFKVVPFRQLDGTMRFFAAPQEVDLSGVVVDGTPFNLENGDIPWDMIKDKPTEFAPAPHTHAIADIEGLADKVASFAEVGHIHTSVDEIGGDATVLDATSSLANASTSRVAAAADRYFVTDFATGTARALARDATMTEIGSVTDAATPGFGLAVACPYDGATVAVAHTGGVLFYEGDMSAEKFAPLPSAAAVTGIAMSADDPTIVVVASAAGASVHKYVRGDGTWLTLSSVAADDIGEVAINASGTVAMATRSSAGTVLAMYAGAVAGASWSASAEHAVPAGHSRLAVLSMEAGIYRTVAALAPAAAGSAPTVSFHRFDAATGSFTDVGTGSAGMPDDTVDDQFERAAAKIALTIPAGVAGAKVHIAAAGGRLVLALGTTAVVSKFAPGTIESEVLVLPDAALGVNANVGRGVVVRTATTLTSFAGISKLSEEVLRQISDIATVVDPGTIQVVDSLESRSRTLALSANQGRILNQRADDIEADVATKVPAEDAVSLRAALDDLSARVAALEANV